MKAPSSAVEAAAKKKKMKQARLPFQTLSTSKSSSDTGNVPSKKRKVTSPVEGCTNPKVKKCTIKEDSPTSVSKNKEEDTEEKHNIEEIEIISDEEKEDLEQDCKNKNITPKSSLRKDKKVDKSHKKPGALTKFFKKTDNEIEHSISGDSDVCESKDEQDCLDKSVHNDDTCNKSSDAYSVESTLQSVSRVSEKLENDNTTSKSAESYSSCQGSDSDIEILSSDNEMLDDLNKSVTSGNETTSKSASSSASSPALRNDKDIKKKLTKLTQKQLAKRQETARKKKEKEKLKMEREKKREEEKANRRKKREEKQKEKQEKERIEKEQKEKEKKLKELRKQMEIEQKQREKEAKEEERRKREEAKEEEKRKKEEEKLEAERKKQKAASNFASFFVSKKQEVKLVEEESIIETKNFMPFEVKADMKIAPVRRRILTKHEKSLLDEKCNANIKKSELYLEDMKKQRIVPRTSSKTWPLETKDDDIILLGEDNDGCSNIIRDTHNFEKHRPKLLQFSDNRRPPYWGTWRKRSNAINPRRPFTKDKKWFDYEVDSDDEWEEEEPGESLKGSDDEKDEENPEENEYDVDNEFMVPHGYLSDEEARADEEEMEDMSPQTQKMKLKLLGEQFEAERNAKTDKLKPKIIGCIWQGFRNTFPESVPTKVVEFLSIRQAWVNHLPIILPSSETSENDTTSNVGCKTPIQQQSGRSTKKTKVPSEALPDLIRLVHGNTHGRHFLLKEFMTFWNRSDKAGEHQLSKASVSQKIKELANWMACPEEGPMHLKSCWYVSKDVQKQYLPDENLTLPNRWTYILTPNRKTDTQDIIDKTEKEEKEKEKRHAPLITQFTKKITQEEMKKQLATKPDQVPATASKLPPLQRPPKRVTLISVGRGESFPERSRENVLAKFVGLKRKEESSSSEKTDSDDVIFIENINRNERANRKSEANNEEDNKTLTKCEAR